MFKRIVPALIALALICSLCACANFNNPKITQPPENTTDTGDPSTTTDPSSTTDTDTTTTAPPSHVVDGKFEDDNLSFNMPSGWALIDESNYIIIKPQASGYDATDIRFLYSESKRPELGSITADDLGSILGEALTNFVCYDIITVDTDSGLSGICVLYSYDLYDIVFFANQYYLNGTAASVVITYTYLEEDFNEALITALVNSVKLR